MTTAASAGGAPAGGSIVAEATSSAIDDGARGGRPVSSSYSTAPTP